MYLCRTWDIYRHEGRVPSLVNPLKIYHLIRSTIGMHDQDLPGAYGWHGKEEQLKVLTNSMEIIAQVTAC
jgi:hypothetical protein